MTKKLIVNKPFGYLEAGDEFILSEDGKMYVAEYQSDLDANVSDNAHHSSFYSRYTISVDYAKKLVDDGTLIQDEVAKTTEFVNVFNEIDKLVEQYQNQLDHIDDADNESAPPCVRLEQRTVLTNLVKVLTYLRKLKK